jgi:hypothetical protein
MKNVMLLGLVAAVLFAVSAGLSLWMNQAKPTEEQDAKAAPSTSRKHKTEESGTEKARPAPRPIVPPLSNGDVDDATRLIRDLQDAIAGYSRRQEEFDQQQELYQIVLEDIGYEMAELQRQWQRVPPESRKSPGHVAEPPVPGATAPPPGLGAPLPENNSRKPGDAGPIDPKNVKVVSGISESMPAENAARIIEQLVKAGSTESVVQLLTKMDAKHAARILSQIQDQKIAVDLVEKLLKAKQASTTEKPSGTEK